MRDVKQNRSVYDGTGNKSVKQHKKNAVIVYIIFQKKPTIANNGTPRSTFGKL